METLVATVLIVIIFMVASMIMNTVFSNTIKNNTRAIDAHLNELQYLHENEKLQLPYVDTWNEWEIYVTELPDEDKVEFEAIHSLTNKTIIID